MLAEYHNYIRALIIRLNSNSKHVPNQAVEDTPCPPPIRTATPPGWFSSQQEDSKAKQLLLRSANNRCPEPQTHRHPRTEAETARAYLWKQNAVPWSGLGEARASPAVLRRDSLLPSPPTATSSSAESPEIRDRWAGESKSERCTTGFAGCSTPSSITNGNSSWSSLVVLLRNRCFWFLQFICADFQASNFNYLNRIHSASYKNPLYFAIPHHPLIYLHHSSFLYYITIWVLIKWWNKLNYKLINWFVADKRKLVYPFQNSFLI